MIQNIINTKGAFSLNNVKEGLNSLTYTSKPHNPPTKPYPFGIARL